MRKFLQQRSLLPFQQPLRPPLALEESSSLTQLKLSLTEDDKVKKVKTHMGATCGCKLYGGKPCSKQFSLTHVLEIRMSAMDLSASELDVAACTNQSTNQSEDVVVESRHLATERINAYSRYTHQGKRVCPYMFGFLNTVGMFRNLKVNKRRNT